MVGSEVVTYRLQELETEADAYELLEQLRWGDGGPTQCPHCGSAKGAWFLKPKDPQGRRSKGGSTARSQRRVWKCRENSCRRQFSVLTNTVMHATKLSVRAWVGTVIDLCEDPAGVSARDIAARWEVTEKSAWAMLNRIQGALTQPEIAGARLSSNAPLWFELSAMDMAEIAGEEHERMLRKARLKMEEQATDSPAADQLRRNGQRALAESAADSFDERAERPVDASFEPVTRREPAQQTLGSTTARPTQADEQVAADVKRVLAEVFGEGVRVEAQVASNDPLVVQWLDGYSPATVSPSVMVSAEQGQLFNDKAGDDA